MANYKLLKRLERIVYLLKSKPGITKKKIIDVLQTNYDLNISERTLERDLKNLNQDFGFQIEYKSMDKGYFLEEDPDRIAAFVKFAELSSLADLYEKGLKDYKTFKELIIPDDSSNFKGIDNMKLIITSISNKQQLSFTKINYNETIEKQYEVTPLILKEYLNRWYLIAVPNGMEEIRTFGLDRIQQLKVLKTNGVKVKDEAKQLAQFKDIVGLNFNESDSVEEIVLKVDNTQIKYLRSLKLHHSQVCVENSNNTGWGTVTYKLKPNYEFEMQLLKLGAMVEVLKPLYFREKIANRIAEMNAIYNR